MASKYLQKFPIPAGFQKILSDFTREVLRDQPSNIIEYAAKYFEMLQKNIKPEFNSKYNVRKEDKKYELAYNVKNAEDITKKATSITAKLNQPVNDQTSSVAPGGTHQYLETQKTISGQQTSKYVENLSNQFTNSQNQHEDLQKAVSETVDRLFSQIDQDHNEFLSSKEINHFIKEVISEMAENVELKQEDIQAFIDIVDNDKDGKISKNQLIEFIMNLFNAL